MAKVYAMREVHVISFVMFPFPLPLQKKKNKRAKTAGEEGDHCFPARAPVVLY